MAIALYASLFERRPELAVEALGRNQSPQAGKRQTANARAALAHRQLQLVAPNGHRACATPLDDFVAAHHRRLAADVAELAARARERSSWQTAAVALSEFGVGLNQLETDFIARLRLRRSATATTPAAAQQAEDDENQLAEPRPQAGIDAQRGSLLELSAAARHDDGAGLGLGDKEDHEARPPPPPPPPFARRRPRVPEVPSRDDSADANESDGAEYEWLHSQHMSRVGRVSRRAGRARSETPRPLLPLPRGPAAAFGESSPEQVDEYRQPHKRKAADAPPRLDSESDAANSERAIASVSRRLPRPSNSPRSPAAAAASPEGLARAVRANCRVPAASPARSRDPDNFIALGLARLPALALSIPRVVKGDGACLFRSLAFLQLGRDDAHLEYRLHALAFAEDNAEYFKPLVAPYGPAARRQVEGSLDYVLSQVDDQEQRWPLYLEGMRRPNEFADHILVVCLLLAYSINLLTFTLNGGDDGESRCSVQYCTPDEAENRHRTYCVANYRDLHFDPLHHENKPHVEWQDLPVLLERMRGQGIVVTEMYVNIS